MARTQFVAAVRAVLGKCAVGLGAQLGAARIDGGALLAADGPADGVGEAQDGDHRVGAHAATRCHVGRAARICEVDARTLARALEEESDERPRRAGILGAAHVGVRVETRDGQARFHGECGHHAERHVGRTDHVDRHGTLVGLLQAERGPRATRLGLAGVVAGAGDRGAARGAQAVTTGHEQFECIAGEVHRRIRCIGVHAGTRGQRLQQVRDAERARRDALHADARRSSHRAHRFDLLGRRRHGPCIGARGNEIHHRVHADGRLAQHGQAHHAGKLVRLRTGKGKTLEREPVAGDGPRGAARGEAGIAQRGGDERAALGIRCVGHVVRQCHVHGAHHRGAPAFNDCLHRAQAPVAEIDRCL